MISSTTTAASFPRKGEEREPVAHGDPAVHNSMPRQLDVSRTNVAADGAIAYGTRNSSSAGQDRRTTTSQVQENRIAGRVEQVRCRASAS
jgi:hypothetical protein